MDDEVGVPSGFLAEHVGRHEGEGRRVEGVDPLVGASGSVARLPLELHHHRGDSEGPAARHVSGPRVEHHDGVDVVPEPILGHDYLGSAAGAVALLGRGPHDDHLPVKLTHHIAHGDTRPDRRCGDEVMATAMAHPRKAVVLRDDSDPGTAPFTLEGRRECGGHAEDLPLHVEAMALELTGEELSGLELLAPQLGVLVDESADLLEAGPLLIHRLLNLSLQLIHDRQDVSSIHLAV